MSVKFQNYTVLKCFRERNEFTLIYPAKVSTTHKNLAHLLIYDLQTNSSMNALVRRRLMWFEIKNVNEFLQRRDVNEKTPRVHS